MVIPMTPSVESTDPDVPIILFEILSISGDYELNDTIPDGEIITVQYIAFNDNNESETFPISILFYDAIAPRIFSDSLPSMLHVGCVNDLPPIDSSTVVDNCTSFEDLDLIFTESELPSLCEGDTVRRSWSATDPQWKQ